MGLGPDVFRGPYFDWTGDYDSWPSGHTTVAFAVATAFHLEYRNKWVSILAYTLAAVGGWSRMHDDKHWASDVLAGATIGIVTTNAIFRARRRRAAAVARRRSRWGPPEFGELPAFAARRR